ncbi:hypothetical protein BDN70DRAFT_995612 [Pholiota conissans]|uniref:Uncharacterized protein n=1 Tax=Pholiota conissans TaxID=109636 RepID=A0A9P5YZ34_9AGAR|nr:hypothetical protein BDN70DRAFT_995612 [Pholiota conissans]
MHIVEPPLMCAAGRVGVVASSVVFRALGMVGICGSFIVIRPMSLTSDVARPMRSIQRPVPEALGSGSSHQKLNDATSRRLRRDAFSSSVYSPSFTFIHVQNLD